MKNGWQIDFNDANWPEVKAGPLVNMAAEIGDRIVLPIDIKPGFCVASQKGFRFPVAYWLRTSFLAQTVPSGCVLAMDQDSLQGQWQLFLNGTELKPHAFRKCFHYDRSNIAAPVSGIMRRGRNTVAIRIVADEESHGLVDPLYIFGKFGVAAADGKISRLVPIVPRAPFNDLAKAGLPFYAGPASYTTRLRLARIAKATPHILRLNTERQPFYDIAELIVNGQSLGVRCFSPYEWMLNNPGLLQDENTIKIRVTNSLGRLIDGYEQKRRERIP